MILQALTRYYDQLLETKPDDIAHPGWCERPVIARLDLDAEGELVNVIPAPEKRGWRMSVPAQEKRAYNVCPNFLCDTSSYLLGIDTKGKPERTLRCFEASKARHLELLTDLDSPFARAIVRFFERWDPAQGQSNPLVTQHADRILAGGNLVFSVEGEDVLENPQIRELVERIAMEAPSDAVIMTCLVSGQNVPIARLHPAIKGVVGAQSSGASLVSFNERAFESYGRKEEQGLNSPVGERAAFAYTTALNYLIGQEDHRVRLGDTTIVYWAERHDDECSVTVSGMLGSLGRKAREEKVKDNTDRTDRVLDAIMEAVRNGTLARSVDVATPFHVLGLAPNASRLSVRFFYTSTFGDVVRNLARHYERITICHAPFEREYLTPYQLLRETENPNAKHHAATSQLGGALMRAILSDSPYPESLYENTLLRIHSTQNDDDKHVRKITRGRAAIVKAYLLKNRGASEQEVTVALNESKTYAPYVLGRIFSILEAVQEAANPNINATIMDKYFDSASTTPAVVFPVIIKLANHHLQKLDRDKPGLAVTYRKQLGGLLDRLPEFPKRLSVEDQGEFILGYYQQTQRRYEKKDKEA